MQIKDRIAQALAHGGLTQAELGKKLRITRSAVSQWVAGTTVPDIRRIEEIALFTGVRKEWLVYGEEPMAAPPTERGNPSPNDDTMGREREEWRRFEQARLRREEGVVPIVDRGRPLEWDDAARIVRKMGARIAQAMDAGNVSDDEAGKVLELNRWNFERVKWGDVWLSDSQFRRLASVLRVSPEWLKFGGNDGPSGGADTYRRVLEIGDTHALQDKKHKETESMPPPEAARVREIYGSLFAGREHGDIMVESVSPFDDGLTGANMWGPIARPSILWGVKDAYAFEMWHDRLEPALKQSCIAFVWPGKAVQPGDEVVANYKNGLRKPAIFGGFAANNSVILRECNPVSETIVSYDEFDKLDLIVLSMRVRM